MKLMPLKEILSMSKEKLDEALAPIRAKQLKSTAELEMAKLEDEIVRKQRAVTEKLSTKDINFPSLMDDLDEISLLELRMTNYEDVLAQLFPKKN